MPERHFCCGSAGTYNLLQPEIAATLGQRKAAHIDSVDPDIVAAGNLGCMVQIAAYTDLPVVHTVELLDWATGGPMPPALARCKLARTGPRAGRRLTRLASARRRRQSTPNATGDLVTACRVLARERSAEEAL